MKLGRAIPLLFSLLLFNPLFGENPPDLAQINELIRNADETALRRACGDRGLDTTGRPADLRRRILDYEMGRYLLPFEEKKTEEGRIVLNHADYIEYREAENGDEIVLLSGSVDVLYDKRRIKADDVRINNTRGLVVGEGDVFFTEEDGEPYVGRSFSYDTNGDRGYFYEAMTPLGNLVYRGDAIRKINDEEKYVAEDVVLTPSAIRYPHARVEADRFYLYEGERALVKNASLYYGQTEVARLPYYYKNVKEKKLQSALHFRERSGLVVQNTYTQVKTDEKQLILKGDFYERLGLYSGVDYNTNGERWESSTGLSAALSNDVYFYDAVEENWSPLGPPGSAAPAISRSPRFGTTTYQKLKFSNGYKNTTELGLTYISDPYYNYDFERRRSGFDIFDFIAQAESDYPRKGDGYSWYLDNRFTQGNLGVTLENDVRFEPQRNTDEEIVSLPDYYDYRLYTVKAPVLGIRHTADVFTGSSSPVIADMTYASKLNYAHLVYYNELGRSSSELHKADTEVSLTKDYYAGDYVRITPRAGIGAEGQHHIDANDSELADDRRRSMVYSRTEEEVQLGPSNVYIEFAHDLKYKWIGPDDLYIYNRYRVHDLGAKAYAEFWKVSDELKTAYDLRPVYDWTTGRYETYRFERERFDPLRNTFIFQPVSQVRFKDVLIYDIGFSEFKTNELAFSYVSDDVYVGEHALNIMWDLAWKHNFINPIVDSLTSTFGLDADLHRFWTAYFRVHSRNDDVWRYLPKTARELGTEPVNLFADLVKSLNFFSDEDRKASYFKMKSISFGFIRDLRDWEMRFDYTGNRELSYDGTRYIWDNTYSISMGLKDVSSVNLHTVIRD